MKKNPKHCICIYTEILFLLPTHHNPSHKKSASSSTTHPAPYSNLHIQTQTYIHTHVNTFTLLVSFIFHIIYP
ncbi:hypothetical protein BDZ91DRAFT_712153 [Kalaharituber pfeilii]|nr:hypothetical protein BDZ91DRAFT_712153 [Kalaharituber pfeilii]